MQRSSALQTALNAGLDPVALVDAAGEILWRNRSWRELFPGQTRGIAELFSRTTCTSILETVHQSVLALSLESWSNSLRTVPLTSYQRSLTVLDLGARVATESVLLLVLRTIPPQNSQPAVDAEYLATIAHDIKNPLGAVLGYADALLAPHLIGPLTDKHRNLIARMKTAATRALELIRNYHHFSKLQIPRGAVRTRTARTALSALVREVVDQLTQPETAGVHAPVTVELPPVDFVVAIEPSQGERIVANLLSNALTYTPATGTIRIQVERRDARAILTVANTSLIPPATLATLFQPFSTSSTSRAPYLPAVPGSGLGLYIAQQLVGRASGTISVESEQERGTTVTVNLPLAEHSV